MPIVRSYGYSLYSAGDYGTEGSVKDSSAVVAAISTVTSGGGRDLSGDAAILATATFAASGDRYRESSGLVSAQSTISAAGESIIIERSDKVPYGAAKYGYNRYDLNDLQTIVSVTSGTTVANGLRVRPVSGSLSASSGSTSSAEVIKLGIAQVDAASELVASAVYTIKGAGSASASSAVTINYIRRRKSDALVASTSGVLTIGREKWESIPVTSITWTNVAA